MSAVTISASGAHGSVDATDRLPASKGPFTPGTKGYLTAQQLANFVANTSGVLGTMATQDANSVNITGGDIDGEAIATFYNRSNILGSVSQSGGTPTGAVIERGSNANGDFVQFADGTLICTLEVLVDVTDTTVQTFSLPASFAARPAAAIAQAVDFCSSAIENQNLRKFGARQNLVFVQLDTAGTASSSTIKDTLSFTVVGRWF